MILQELLDSLQRLPYGGHGAQVDAHAEVGKRKDPVESCYKDPALSGRNSTGQAEC